MRGLAPRTRETSGLQSNSRPCRRSELAMISSNWYQYCTKPSISSNLQKYSSVRFGLLHLYEVEAEQYLRFPQIKSKLNRVNFMCSL